MWQEGLRGYRMNKLRWGEGQIGAETGRNWLGEHRFGVACELWFFPPYRL